MAQEFARVLGVGGRRQNGYLESETAVVTWCLGHLITMSYPEKYDPKYKQWNLDTLPFLPDHYLYEVIEDVKSQFETVKKLLNREDVGTIYICTDSGREGEYIYRLVDQMAGVKGKVRKRVWIDSQTEEEIQRGVREAKDWSAYDNLSSAAFLRAQEDYLMGINFSRALTLRCGGTLSGLLRRKHTVVSVGRVMTCVLGMVVRREREIRSFQKTPFYRVTGSFLRDKASLEAEWRAVSGSEYFESPKLYKENGFRKKEDAEELIRHLETLDPESAAVLRHEKKKEIRRAPLLYNLAEIQNDCSKRFRISPDRTLEIIQELYEKKLVTYPRTDARVLSSAVAKEIGRNLSGLKNLPGLKDFAEEVLSGDAWKKIGKSRYTDDAQITDHYAIIPTGQGLGALRTIGSLQSSVYEMICRRFLAIFYPPAVYEKHALEIGLGREHFFLNLRILTEKGWLAVTGDSDSTGSADPALRELISSLRKGSRLKAAGFSVREGETSPPKRYTSGSMILAMENAGQLIEDEELRSQIRSTGIGTSATRAEILKKLVKNQYLALSPKTQVITPTLLGEMIYEAVNCFMRQLLNPELTASWEKGLSYVAEGSITPEEYSGKLRAFVARRTNEVKAGSAGFILRDAYEKIHGFYREPVSGGTRKKGAAEAGGTRKAGAAGTGGTREKDTAGVRGARRTAGRGAGKNLRGNRTGGNS